MAYFPEKRTLPPYLANAFPPVTDNSRTLTFDMLPGSYVSKHRGGVAVDVVRVSNFHGFEEALLFRTPLNEDLDGAPNSYAPPISASNVSPKDGLAALDNIKNATNQSGEVFHDDPDLNTFEWTGVVSTLPGNANGRPFDNRPFLRDARGRFPLFQPAASATSQFYAPQTAMNGVDGQAVNPLEVPFAALSASLRENGHVGLGDFGLAIRASTGSATGFLYADAGGRSSTSVGECSRRMIRSLFGGPAAAESICYVVFPGTSAGPAANAALITPRVQRMLGALARYDNSEDMAKKLLFPLATANVPADYRNLPEYRNLIASLRAAGMRR